MASTLIPLSGRWVGRIEGGGHVLEFEVTDAPLNWQPAAHATIYFRSRKPLEVPVVQQATTRPGSIDPGRLVRLALKIETEVLEKILFVEIDCGGCPIKIVP